ncbi:MAG: 30S ribosomal protein S1, partial [Synechococcus sp. LacPavin_0920_WC12_MAG_50_7]|nr:30S ribosomal protein S1 [Synechococcus sp. LacPavin_0920_WC12_MAG_50_7]
GRISLSTKALEPEPGDMLTDPQKVFDNAEEMAARYKQMLLEQADEPDADTDTDAELESAELD